MSEHPHASERHEPRFYPNLIGRLYLLSLEDVMGRNGVHALLHLAGCRHLVNNYPPNNLKREFPFADLARISEATHTMYGQRGARGMELRAGRYAFNLGLKEFGPLLGMADLALKLMPIAMKLKIALNATAQTFHRFSDQPTHVEERKGQFVYVIEQCPICWGRTTTYPAGALAQGILEEALTWVSGGHTFPIQQTDCQGMGCERCIFAIAKEPTD
jgi:predicted hydrocarbon binding protein